MTQLFSVCAAAAPLYRKASRKSALETQLVLGEIFAAEITHRGWAKGQAQSPITDSKFTGYEGYVPLKYLRPYTSAPNAIVTALSAPVFKSANIKSPVQALWPMNSRFNGQSSGDFYETEIGYVHHRHVRQLEKPPSEVDFVAAAERHIGRPYIWGGVISDGLDCSGLVQASLRATGRDAPRDACDQEHMGDILGHDEPQRRGDLIFWKGHVGIMQDAETLLHANAFHMAVASEPLETAIARIKKSGGPVTSRRRI